MNREHNLEIENRIRNLFWTVSGDYDLSISPDVDLFVRSKYAAFYEAVKQGAFARYFDAKELSLYFAKKIYLGAEKNVLMELGQLCVDAAVYPKIKTLRLGIEELRHNAFLDLLEMQAEIPPKHIFAKVKVWILRRELGCESSGEDDTQAKDIWKEIYGLERAEEVSDIICVIDRLYNQYYDTNFEVRHGNLARVHQVLITEIAKWAWQDCLTDEQMEQILQDYLAKIQKELAGLEIQDELEKRPAFHADWGETKDDIPFDREAERKVVEYVELNYGKTYLSIPEQEARNQRLCRGIHQGCLLHYTDGILHAPVKKNNQYRFSQLQFEKNRLYYGNHHWIIKRNIADLADILRKSLVLRMQTEKNRAIVGELVPSRLWKVGRTQDKNLFDKTTEPRGSDFVVDILLDSSGSQSSRQPQVATQGFIISEALSMLGIPHRVLGYCTFWNHTVIRRFRDYEDQREKNIRIFEFRASANNRDGLVIKAVGEELAQRLEMHKIMIILSDGKPNDVGISRPGVRSIKCYSGETAAKDTAFEVRRVRSADFSVFGIFAGSEEDLPVEKRIFGKDFAYIRNISNFSRIVGTYLKGQFEGI